MNDVAMWRTAAQLLAAHGETAEAEALKCADAALDGGDVDGFNRWKRVAWLIVEMRKSSPRGSSDVH